MPNNKLHVVIIGDDTRLASSLLALPTKTDVRPDQFCIWEQDTPQAASYCVVFNHYISLTGDVL